MKLETLNQLKKLNDYGEWESIGFVVPALDAQVCTFLLEEFDPDKDFLDFKNAINQFLNLERSDFIRIEEYLYEYYLDIKGAIGTDEYNFPRIKKVTDVWSYVGFGFELSVRRRDKDNKVYVAVPGACDWEEEHGLQVVFKEGLALVKIGPFTGHITNSDVFADPALESIVYKRLRT